MKESKNKDMSSIKVFWPGNSAKTRIIREIIQSSGSRPILIFDYGCGDTSGWRDILENHLNIAFVGYDPNQHAIWSAGAILQGLPVRLYTGSSIEELSFQADYIVSFSVFEHVYDRKKYMYHAKRLLAPHGIFYLNYDDGHFRVSVNLNEPSQWTTSVKAYLHNILSPILARAGWLSKYQRRVSCFEADILTREMGFKIVREFYSNLSCFKGLYKSIPTDKQAEFMEMWLDTEQILNEKFNCDGPLYLGDTKILWRFMGSRTLVLVHDHSGREDTL